MVPEKRFYSLFGSTFQVSNLILKASLKYFIQYFASVLAYTSAVAGIPSTRKAVIYLINNNYCGFSRTMRSCVRHLRRVSPGPK